MDILIDAVMDSAKLLPFLFLTFLAMEAIETLAEERAEQIVRKADVIAPAIGSVAGIIPHFAVAAATLYSGRVITLGTLFAVFLATSDEMLPVFIAEGASPVLIGEVLICKIVIGMVMGFLVDLVQHLRSHGSHHLHIHEMCEEEDCECEDGIFVSALKHTVKVFIFVFVITLILNAVIEGVGENVIAGFLSAYPELAIIAAGIVGLIPNCAASVVISELFLEGTLSTAAMMSGLLVASGVSLLVLCRTNHSVKGNITIIGLLLLMGIFWGFVFEIAGVSFL